VFGTCLLHPLDLIAGVTHAIGGVHHAACADGRVSAGIAQAGAKTCDEVWKVDDDGGAR
jgi:hypothetical protein